MNTSVFIGNCAVRPGEHIRVKKNGRIGMLSVVFVSTFKDVKSFRFRLKPRVQIETKIPAGLVLSFKQLRLRNRITRPGLFIIHFQANREVYKLFYNSRRIHGFLDLLFGFLLHALVRWGWTWSNEEPTHNGKGGKANTSLQWHHLGHSSSTLLSSRCELSARKWLFPDLSLSWLNQLTPWCLSKINRTADVWVTGVHPP